MDSICRFCRSEMPKDETKCKVCGRFQTKSAIRQAWFNGTIDGEAATENLITLFNNYDTDREDKDSVIESIGFLHSPLAIPFLSNIIKNEEFSLKQTAYRALEGYGDLACSRALASTIGRYTSGFSVPALKEILGGERDAVVAKLIADISDDNGVSFAGWIAVEAAGYIPAPEAVPELIRAMIEYNQGGKGRPQLFTALGRIGGKEAISALSSQLGKGKDPVNNVWIIESLELAGEDAIPILRQASLHPWPYIAEAANKSLNNLEALGHINPTPNPSAISEAQRERRMSGFTDERLSDWFEFIEGEYPSFAILLRENRDSIKQRIRDFNALTPTEKHYGLLIPIMNKTWALRDAGGVTNGALAGLNDRFIVFDFEKNAFSSFSYDSIADITMKGSDLHLYLDSNRQLSLKFKLPIKRKLAWSFSNIFMGATGAGTDRHDAAKRYVLMEATRENSGRANDEAAQMIEYLGAIFSYFIEACEGQERASNEV